jgi:phosphodiesterase/alkaline phosphatase D-like protein
MRQLQGGMGMKNAILTALLCLGLSTFGLAQTADVQITKGPEEQNITSNSAEVVWTTNVQGSSTVEYGTDKNNLDQTARGGWGGPEHRTTLRNLKPGTTYYYRVLSTEGKVTGTGAIARTDSFTTLAAGSGSQGGSGSSGPNPKEITITSGPTVQNVTDKTAEIYWVTNTKGSSTVQYGTDQNNLNQTAHGGWGGPEHRTRLGNLQPGTTYYYRILSKDALGTGDQIEGTVQSFQTSGAATGAASTAAAGTAATPATTGSPASGDVTVTSDQITSGPFVRTVGRDSAEIFWTTTIPSYSVVRFGTDRNNLAMSAQGPSGLEHRVTVPNLMPDTVYYVKVQTTGALPTAAAGEKIIGFRTAK